MSLQPITIPCPKCTNNVSKKEYIPNDIGYIERKFLDITFLDICDRCGGSRRVSI